MAAPSVIVFDLMGTLLNLSGLDDAFHSEFGDSQLRREWFSEVLKLALAITAAGGYESFSNIAEAALKVIEERHQHKLSGIQRKKLLQLLNTVPAFPDVAPGLQRLQSSGSRLIVLTNWGQKTAKQAIKSAGLSHFFEKILSVEDVKRLKPAPEPYRMAARKCGVRTGKLLLVAAHSWDLAGATRAACRACFIRRPGQVLDELTPKPDFIVSDLTELAGALTDGTAEK